MQIQPYCKSKHPYAGIIRKAFLDALSLVGALALTLLLVNFTFERATEWSPTETAHKCFHYPGAPSGIDRDSVAEVLLSAVFFGSDALYFDGGEENTGATEPYIPSTSDSERGDTPQPPIGEGQISHEIDMSIYDFNRAHITMGEIALVPYDLTQNPDFGEILLTNTTKYQIDTDMMLSNKYPIKANLSKHSQSEPLVLIVHTHGTESYSPYGVRSVPSEYVHRSSDTSKNMISVGNVMADMLNDAGIPTIHCEIMHDLESYTRSYSLAADTIQKYLAKYPSIQYVFDVHRDAITRANGDLIRPITMINGEISAQVMLLVGTDEQGADHPDWKANMTVATQLQHRLTSSYERFARPINIRTASFNEQFAKGSLLIEIGSAANSLEEAKTAAKYLTYSIIDMIKDNEG